MRGSIKPCFFQPVLMSHDSGGVIGGARPASGDQPIRTGADQPWKNAAEE